MHAVWYIGRNPSSITVDPITERMYRPFFMLDIGLLQQNPLNYAARDQMVHLRVINDMPTLP